MVGLALGAPLVPITPICVVSAASPMYRALRQYKSGEPCVARRQTLRLARVIDAFVRSHSGVLAPGGLDVSVVVPSSPGGRPSPHPLAAVLSQARGLPAVADLLTRGPERAAHMRPSRDAYRVRRDVCGLRVLLVDDVYTSGAHLQSAARALLDAGAAVHPLVIGRFVGKAPSAGAARVSGPSPIRPKS